MLEASMEWLVMFALLGLPGPFVLVVGIRELRRWRRAVRAQGLPLAVVQQPWWRRRPREGLPRLLVLILLGIVQTGFLLLDVLGWYIVTHFVR
jgi:hypothetical protein